MIPNKRVPCVNTLIKEIVPLGVLGRVFYVFKANFGGVNNDYLINNCIFVMALSDVLRH
jgi:hypothetical protein